MQIFLSYLSDIDLKAIIGFMFDRQSIQESQVENGTCHMYALISLIFINFD
jgi:hypothetical protein